MSGRPEYGSKWTDLKEWLVLMGKSFLMIGGGILVIAAILDIAVGEPWFVKGPTFTATFEQSPGLVLVVGLALALPPLGFAFRDALREARKGHPRDP